MTTFHFDTMDGKAYNVVVCGGGNGAHTFSCLASSRLNMEVRILTLFEDEAARWRRRLELSDMVLTICNADGSETVIESRPTIVTNNPKEATSHCNVIFLTVPAFAHNQYLKALTPFIQRGSLIIGMPGRAGFEFEVFNVIGDKAKSCTVVSFETLPWACRFLEFGHSVIVHGTKECVMASVIGQANFKHNAFDLIQFLLGGKPKIIKANNYLEINLLSKSIFHPSVMYGYWNNWDGNPLDVAPLFYNGINDKSVEVLEHVDAEIIAIARKIGETQPKMKMSNIQSAYDWLLAHYPLQITDGTNLLTAFRTNKGYNGLKHPMKKTYDGKYVPDFHSRYLVEDVPYGLVVFRGIASIVGVETPFMDEVIKWCQNQTGKQYLIGTELAGKDIYSTRAPQRFGFHCVDDLMKMN